MDLRDAQFCEWWLAPRRSRSCCAERVWRGVNCLWKRLWVNEIIQVDRIKVGITGNIQYRRMGKCMRPSSNLSYLTGIGCSDELALQWGKALDLSAYSGTDDYFCPLGPRAACVFGGKHIVYIVGAFSYWSTQSGKSKLFTLTLEETFFVNFGNSVKLPTQKKINWRNWCYVLWPML